MNCFSIIIHQAARKQLPSICFEGTRIGVFAIYLN